MVGLLLEGSCHKETCVGVSPLQDQAHHQSGFAGDRTVGREK